MSGTNVVFRADADNVIATGHINRCLTLANEIRKRGITCTFVCRIAEGNLISFIREQGYEVHPLPANPTVAEDARLTAAYLQSLSGSVRLVVDSYQRDATFEQHLRPYVDKLLVLDDLADRPHDCDVLVDFNLIPGREAAYRALTPSHSVNLIGPVYALLRDEFLEERTKMTARSFPPRNILLNYGGGDQKHMILRSMDALESLGYDGKLTVVAGGQNPDVDEIEARCNARPDSVYYHTTNQMAKLMRKADLSIGAGGSAMWERFCLGLPTVTVAVSETQIETAESLASENLVFYAGTSENLTTELFATCISHAMTNERKFRRIEQHANTFDGMGVKKVANALLS